MWAIYFSFIPLHWQSFLSSLPCFFLTRVPETVKLGSNDELDYEICVRYQVWVVAGLF